MDWAGKPAVHFTEAVLARNFETLDIHRLSASAAPGSERSTIDAQEGRRVIVTHSRAIAGTRKFLLTRNVVSTEVDDNLLHGATIDVPK